MTNNNLLFVFFPSHKIIESWLKNGYVDQVTLAPDRIPDRSKYQSLLNFSSNSVINENINDKQAFFNCFM